MKYHNFVGHYAVAAFQKLVKFHNIFFVGFYFIVADKTFGETYSTIFRVAACIVTMHREEKTHQN
jgi:hypothetical protein